MRCTGGQDLLRCHSEIVHLRGDFDGRLAAGEQFGRFPSGVSLLIFSCNIRKTRAFRAKAGGPLHGLREGSFWRLSITRSSLVKSRGPTLKVPGHKPRVGFEALKYGLNHGAGVCPLRSVNRSRFLSIIFAHSGNASYCRKMDCLGIRSKKRVFEIGSGICSNRVVRSCLLLV